jgi:ATP-dependent DNA helicase RecG
MDLQELSQIVSRGEDGSHQFKEDIHNVDSLAAEMVAFSNYRGGQIFIGVTDLKVLKGLSSDDVQRINQLISNAASQHVRSPIIVQTENISVGTRRIVIVLTIFEGSDKPYFDQSGVIWLKSGADKRRIKSKEELRHIFQENGDLYADEARVRVGIEALDLSLFSQFFKKFYNSSLPESVPAQLQLLENMNLAKGDRLTLAGLLLFGKEPQLHKPLFIIKAISFAGHKIANTYLDSEDFEGPIVKVFQGALAFIMRNLRKVQNQKSVNSIGDPEIPSLVFEELLVNALIHRDYHIMSSIRLFVFSDRIEIISPGHLPNHLTVEKILSGTSIARNPILISFIAKGILPYRGLGSGIRRALEGWPQIQFVDDRDGCTFKTIIQRVDVENAVSKLLEQQVNDTVNDTVNDPLSEVEIQILKLILKNPNISYQSIATNLEKSRITIGRHIQQLKSRKILQRIGSDKKGYWVVKTN